VRTRFEQLAPRERIIVGAGAAVLGMALFFVVVLQPLAARTAQARARLAYDQETLALVERAAERARVQHAQGARAGRLPAGTSPLALISSTAASHGIGTAIRRIAPGEAGTVQLSFEQVAFDQLVAWLLALGEQYGIEVARISIDALGKPGLVRASILLAMRA
jgi:general secretion pathway protein M